MKWMSLHLKIWVGSDFKGMSKLCQWPCTTVENYIFNFWETAVRKDDCSSKLIFLACVYMCVCTHVCICASQLSVRLWFPYFPSETALLTLLQCIQSETMTALKWWGRKNLNGNMQRHRTETERYWVSICLSAQGLRLQSIIWTAQMVTHTQMWTDIFALSTYGELEAKARETEQHSFVISFH